MVGNPGGGVRSPFVIVGGTLGEDTAARQDGDTITAVPDPEHVERSVKRSCSNRSRCLGMLAGFEVCLRGMRMVTGREACVASVQLDEQKLFVHERVEHHLANFPIDMAQTLRLFVVQA
jgi:hypothetical protein